MRRHFERKLAILQALRERAAAQPSKPKPQIKKPTGEVRTYYLQHPETLRIIEERELTVKQAGLLNHQRSTQQRYAKYKYRWVRADRAELEESTALVDALLARAFSCRPQEQEPRSLYGSSLGPMAFQAFDETRYRSRGSNFAVTEAGDE